MKKTIYALLIALTGSLAYANRVHGQAELQVIHNCADPAASEVDIYVNGTNALDDFAFRTATPFIQLPSGVPLNIGVAPGTSTSVNDTIRNFTVTLMAGEKYVAIARGVLNPASFAVNPDGISTAFDLTLIADAQTGSVQPANVDLAVHHGSTDAPAVDVIARNVATLVDNAPFGAATGYLEIPAGNYLLDITPANDNSVLVASFQADITTLAGGAGVVFASGFLNPAANQNGAAFGLFAALSNGTVIPLPQTSLARLQVIHNAADPAAASVDVYVNGTLAVPGFAFRTATPYIDIPGDVVINVGVAPANSTGVNDTLVNFPVQFQNGGTYVAIANGVLNPASFAPNPDGQSTAFTLFVQPVARESAQNSSNVEFFVVHGSTDAPTVDVQLNGTSTLLVDNAAYSDVTGYLSVPPAVYNLDITPGNDNTTIVATFQADLTPLAGATAAVFASGFLNPAANQNGAAFGLWASLPDGTTVPLSVVTGISESFEASSIQLYPNPVQRGSAVILSGIPAQSSELMVTDVTGRNVFSGKVSSEGETYELDTTGLPAGVYAVTVSNGTGTFMKKLVIQ